MSDTTAPIPPATGTTLEAAARIRQALDAVRVAADIDTLTGSTDGRLTIPISDWSAVVEAAAYAGGMLSTIGRDRPSIQFSPAIGSA